MGAVAVGVGVDVVGTVEGKSGAPLELLVLLHDARVDDEGGDALARRVVKGVGVPPGLSRRHAGEAGGGVLLGDEGIEVDIGVGLDVGDLVGAVDLEGGGVVGLEAHGTHAADAEGVDGHAEHAVVYGGALANVALGDGIDPVGLVRGDGVIVKGVVVDHDELVWDDVLGIGVHNGKTETLWFTGRGRGRGPQGEGGQEGKGGEKRGRYGSHGDGQREVSTTVVVCSGVKRTVSPRRGCQTSTCTQQRKKSLQGNEMVRKVEGEPVLDNGNQWQEEEDEVAERRSGRRRKVDFIWWGGGGGSGGETGSSPRAAAGVSNKSRN